MGVLWRRLWKWPRFARILREGGLGRAFEKSTYSIPKFFYFLYHAGLMRAPLYLEVSPIVPGVSTLPFLLGIAIFKHFRDPYGIPTYVTNFVAVFSF